MIDLNKARADSIEGGSPELRLETLERVVLDLMMEVEALRETCIRLAQLNEAKAQCQHVLDNSPAGVSGDHHPYGHAYLETAWLTHWSAGLTRGWDKLVERFYGHETPGLDGSSLRLRELIMLHRLGYSQTQIAEYVESAQAAETCT